ncbi:methylmalonyl-CoA mutase family protein [Henriciella marina]|uniref:methylmalonyl-CoA mutase family protein n=1 Tax=Henriciella marina TaxID=453851 RepID=UPI000367FF35|nr:methylmalonyl-CoA mutase family protein [Henriciella marina]
MADGFLKLSGAFDEANEADWLEAVSKALKGGGIERLQRTTDDGLTIQPLYRENDFASATDPRGVPGEAPYLRGASAEPDAFLPWDIRQSFGHPDPDVTNSEILRDLERGVSSVELAIDCTGKEGVAIYDADTLSTALAGVRADIATIAVDHRGLGSGTSIAGLLALWGEQHGDAEKLRFAFNIDPIGLLTRKGEIEGGIDAAFVRTAELSRLLCLRYPKSTTLRTDARPVHEAGGSEAQELGVLIAHAVDTMRRLDAAGFDINAFPSQTVFTLAASGNYGLEIAKLRAARRLWARVQDAMDLEIEPMTLQSVSSARMLTRYDPWVNMLRNTAACFAGAVGGADIVTVRAFNEALGVPEELGRRTARNTQVIAMEESGLGRIADPAGGAWFEETLADDLAEAAWAVFQAIEAEGGLVQSLIDGKLQARIAETRDARFAAIAKRKRPLTGVSEFPLLDAEEAPVAEIKFESSATSVSAEGLHSFLKDLPDKSGPATKAAPLEPIRLARDFETLRDRADAHADRTGKRPQIFIATLGPLAEHNARVDFARNLFASGGVEGVDANKLPETSEVLADAFKASGCRIAVICGADKRYEDEAEAAAKALKDAGAQRVYLAGKFEAPGIDNNIFMGCDAVDMLQLAQAELGVAK